MEPISAILGLGLSIYGTIGGMGASEDYNRAQSRQIDLERQVEGQRYQAATLKHERDQMEILRNNQRARAMGLQAATSQGAQMGSGLAGAYGQFAGASGTNLLNENQNWQIGQNVFGLNSKISDNKIDMASAQRDQQTYQGISSLGGSIFSASKSLSNVFSGPSNTAPQPNFGMGLYKGNQTGMFY